MNRRYRWLAYIPVKLHRIIPLLGGLCGHWIALRFSWPTLPCEIAGLIVTAPIGIALQFYKQQARAILKENNEVGATGPK